jgi:RNA polymerase primary sigma factor
MDLLDLAQEANIALLQAFDLFPFDGVFRAWFLTHMRFHLKKVIWNGGGDLVRLHWKLREAIFGIAEVEQRYLQKFDRSPSSSELSLDLGLSLSRVYELLHYRELLSMRSIEAFCASYEEPEDHHDFSALYQQLSEDEVAFSDVRTRWIDQAIAQLSPRRQEVMRLRYGLAGEGSHTADEVGERLGIERRKVHSTVNHAKERLRVSLASLCEKYEAVV